MKALLNFKWLSHIPQTFKRFIKADSIHSVLVLPLLHNKIVLVKVYRPLFRNYQLELPRERIKQGEDVADAVRRAVKEELGTYVISVPKKLGSVIPESSLLKNRCKIYLAHISDETDLKSKDTSEIHGHILLPLSSVLRLIQKGTIQDALTISAVWLYQSRLHKV